MNRYHIKGRMWKVQKGNCVCKASSRAAEWSHLRQYSLLIMHIKWPNMRGASMLHDLRMRTRYFISAEFPVLNASILHTGRGCFRFSSTAAKPELPLLRLRPVAASSELESEGFKLSIISRDIVHCHLISPYLVKRVHRLKNRTNKERIRCCTLLLVHVAKTCFTSPF